MLMQFLLTICAMFHLRYTIYCYIDVRDVTITIQLPPPLPFPFLSPPLLSLSPSCPFPPLPSPLLFLLPSSPFPSPLPFPPPLPLPSSPFPPSSPSPLLSLPPSSPFPHRAVLCINCSCSGPVLAAIDPLGPLHTSVLYAHLASATEQLGTLSHALYPLGAALYVFCRPVFLGRCQGRLR